MQSVKAKLATLVVTAVVTSVLLVSVISAWKDAERRFSAKRAELMGIAATIATSVAHPLSNGDTDNVARTLSAIGRIPGITFARVSDANEKLVHQFGFGVVVTREPGSIASNPVIGPWSFLHLETYPVAAPIISGGVHIGKLTLIADLSSLRGALFDSLMSAFLAGVLACAVGLFLSRRLQKAISDPVTSLTTAMDEVARTKDFSRSVVKTSSDEIGRLVDSFNGMLSEVRTRDQALEEHRDNLENQVDERTRQWRTATAEAEAASAAKSEFLATMSHEIRTPMNGMLVMAELLATGALTPKLQRYADVLLNSGQTLLAIINDILDFSKIEAGKLELESIPVDIRRLIDETVQLFHGRAVSKGLELAAEVGSGVPLSIAADPVRLTQILSNLVNNALKFTETGRVTITISACDDFNGAVRGIRIQVSDSGIGIPAEKLASVFEAFSQADQATTRRFGGTGIGLTICRRLVAAMSGTIAVSSQDGEGSTFTVQLPVVVLEDIPEPLTIELGQSDSVLVAIQSTLLRDIICRAASRRRLKTIAIDPAAVTRADVQRARAVIGGAVDLAVMSNAIMRDGVNPDTPIIVALATFGESCAADLHDANIVDRVLEAPLSICDLNACLDVLVQGRQAVAAERPVAQFSRDSADQSLAHLRVLAADDNAVNREVLAEALRRLGVGLVCVENGLQAVDAAKSETFDLILMDCSMPIMDGYEATRKIRDWEQHDGRAPLPIIALTAYVIGESASSWREAGMSGYLTKPYTLSALRRCLEQSVVIDDAAPAQSPAQDDSAAAVVMTELEDDDLIDVTVLGSIRELEGPGDNIVERIAALYALHAPQALVTLVALDPTIDSRAFADAAHALRSMSRNIGALRVARLCTDVERRARRGDHSTFKDDLTLLSNAVPATLCELEKFVFRSSETSEPGLGGGIASAAR